MAEPRELFYDWRVCPAPESAPAFLNGTEMTDDIVGQGVELMLYGMGTVVVFLALLIVITTAMSTVINRYFPEAPAPAPATPRPAATAEPSEEVVAAISAAIHQHRSKRS